MTIFIYIIAALVSTSLGYALNKVLSGRKSGITAKGIQMLEQTKKK